jgi:hypothetical protein
MPARDRRRSFNGGFWDGRADRESERRRDRRDIRRGELFALPSWDKAYRLGYAAGRDGEPDPGESFRKALGPRSGLSIDEQVRRDLARFR